jgi:hypothetical protein
MEHAMLQAVKDSEGLRRAVEEVQPERVKLSLRISQSKPLYDAFRGIRDGPSWSNLTEAQQRLVEGELRDFVLGGVALEVRGATLFAVLYAPQKYLLHMTCVVLNLGQSGFGVGAKTTTMGFSCFRGCLLSPPMRTWVLNHGNSLKGI